MSKYDWTAPGNSLEQSVADGRFASEADDFDPLIARLSAAAQVKAALAELVAAALNGTAGNVRRGAGSPEGVVTADRGVIYEQTDGTGGTVLWVKLTDGTNTGWVDLDLSAITNLLDGTGSPEAVVTAAVGTLYLQTDGTYGRTLWEKRTGTGNTGWALLSTSLSYYNVRDYGALGDGSTDDGAAIQACITACSAAGGGTVFVPPGTYLLSSPQGAFKVLLRPRSNVTIRGAGKASVLKAANGLNTATANRGYSFISHIVADESIASCDNFAITDLCFDHNGLNNLVTGAGAATNSNQALEIQVGTNIRFERNYCLNNAGTQTVSLGSNPSGAHTIKQVVIANNIFYGMGAGVVGNSASPDHSTIYCQANGAVISGNEFLNDSLAANTPTAIEDHSSNSTVTGNVIRKYNIGVNVVATVTDHRTTVYSGNTLYDVLEAFRFYQAGAFVMDGVRLLGNLCVQSDGNPGAGAFLDVDSNVAVGISSLEIADNTFDSLKTAGTANTACGVEVGRIVKCVIRGNSFKGFSGRAIQLGTPLTTTRLIIDGNLIEDCGTTSTAANRQGIALNTATTLEYLRIADNTVRNTASNTYMTSGIIGNAPMGAGQLVDNSVQNITTAIGWTADANILVRHIGSGTPESAIRSLVGGEWTRTDLLQGAVKYLKVSGAGTTTGWRLLAAGNVSADRGDTANTITWGVEEPIQRFDTTLTASRTQTLSTTNAVNGAQFIFLRTGGGNFGLAIGTTVLRPNQGAAFRYTGSAWVQEAVWSFAGETQPVTNINNASSPYTAVAYDRTITCDASSGAITVNLPAGSSFNGRILVIKKDDSSANAVTISRAGADTIDGATSYTLSVQYQYVALQVGTNGSWKVLTTYVTPSQTANDNSSKLASTAYVDRATTHTGTTSAAPTGTASLTAVMMGLAGSITPTRGTKIIVMVSGQMSNNTINDGATVDLRFGTSTAPTNGAAVTGTLVGIAQTATSLIAADRSGFCVMGKVTGLSVGTAYWLDLSLMAVTGGTATVTGVSVVAFEVP